LEQILKRKYRVHLKKKVERGGKEKKNNIDTWNGLKVRR